jgi:DUF4097 and DUF4098 domain-containing protein YvlB
MRTRIMTGILVALLIAFMATPGFCYNDTVQKSFTVKEGGTLFITADLGAIEIVSGSSSRVQVSISREIDSRDYEDILDDMDISMRESGGDVTVELKYDRYTGSFFWNLRDTSRVRIVFRVTVPEKYNVELKTSGGGISVDTLKGNADCRTSGGPIKLRSVNGPVVAKTSGGSIRLESSSGDAELNTSGGGITVGDVTGDVVAHTSGGGITIERVQGTVDAHTSGGSVTVHEVGGTVNASTSGGSISATITQQPAGNCRLTTSGGSVTVHLNDNYRFDIDAQTSGGGVHADNLTLQLQNMDKNRLVATMNGGGPELYLRSSGGSINIKKQ